MKICYISDAHLEMNLGPRTPVPTDTDVLVLDGDMHVGADNIIRVVRMFHEELGIGCHTIFTCGNHEYYDRFPMDHTNGLLYNAFIDNPYIHFLQDDSLIIDDVLFVGGTLWTDFCVDGHPEYTSRMVVSGRNDFRYIDELTVNRWVNMHHSTRQYITDTLEAAEYRKSVVITHYGGHRKLNGVAPFKQGPLKGGFVSHIEEIRPDLWISGHTHEQLDFEDGGTRFVSNCYGYEMHEPELIKAFEWKVIEI